MKHLTKTKCILRATYLDRVNKTGKRPFAKAVFQPRQDSNHPLGLCEMLHPLSREIDFFHNLRIDYGTFASMPIGFYRPSSNLEKDKIGLEPGMLIPLDNPQTDVVFPNMGLRTQFGMQEEAELKAEIERLTSISDLNLGVLSGAQGATRTATGAAALVSEASANLDVYLRRLNVAWQSILEYLFGMLQQRIPQGLAFRLLGEDGIDVFREVPSREVLAGNYDFIVSPNSATSNRQIQLDTASQILQLTADPFAIQLGIVTPAEYYEARKNFLKQLGVKDFGKFLRKPKDIPRVYTPMEELDLVMAGVEVPLDPMMDHIGFVTLWEKVKEDDNLLGQFNEEQTIMAERQSVAHQQMLQSLQQMRNQQANLQQQQTNQQNAQQQQVSPQPAPPPAGVPEGGSEG
jgi:hypothetical protein